MCEPSLDVTVKRITSAWRVMYTSVLSDVIRPVSKRCISHVTLHPNPDGREKNVATSRIFVMAGKRDSTRHHAVSQ